MHTEGKVDQGFKATWTKLRDSGKWGVLTVGDKVKNEGFLIVEVTKKSGETSAEFLGRCVGRFTTDEGLEGAYWLLEKDSDDDE